ncbi:retrovirus-related pol polyprotein from transposon TNT 1-94, partial [Tanacetum coccineum]
LQERVDAITSQKDGRIVIRSMPVNTEKPLLGENDTSIKIPLVDAIIGWIVSTRPESMAKLEIVVILNKKDERGIMIKNKARLVAQGYTQEEGIDYDEIGKIDKTLFIKRDKGDILLVQVYVDDIILGFTKKSLCTKFEKMTHKKFQMSSMGEIIFFLGLQVKQKEDGIFISQDKYVTEILKKFSFTDVKTAITPMETQNIPCARIPSQPNVAHLMLLVQETDCVANSTTEAAYVAASSCCGQGIVQWTKKLIQMVKIHTDKNVADLLTKDFDVKSGFGNWELELMLLKVNDARHNLLLLLNVNNARHNLLVLLKVNATRHNLLLLLKVNAASHKLTTAVESFES